MIFSYDTIFIIAMTRSENDNLGVYKPRNAKQSAYYRCVENHFQEFKGVWDDRYAPRYGFWRPYITDVIYRYLDCGDLHCGFARVRCDECGHEYLLAFSCKRRHPRFLEDKLLPLLPSKKGGRIRRMAVDERFQKGPAPPVGFEHTEKIANLFYV
jgi:hypothetical protein